MNTPTVVRCRRALLSGCASLFLLASAAACSPAGSAQTSLSLRDVALPAPLPPSPGASFYVSTKGSDRNPGSLAHPWRTILKALRTLGPGQIAYVRAGVYRANLVATRSGTASRSITVRNYPGEAPVLRPATRSPSYPMEFQNVAYIRFRGFIVENAVGSSIADVYVSGTSHNIEISRCRIRRSRQQGIFTDSTTREVQILRNSIHNNGSVSDVKQDHGIYVEGANHLIADNVIFNQPHGYGIQVYPNSNGVIVVQNTIVANALGGIVVGGNGQTTADNTLVANNIVAYNAGYGIRGYYSSGQPGSGNVAVRNLAFANRAGNYVNDSTYQAVIAFSANIVGNPRFIDLVARNLHLGSASAALDKALAAYSLRYDREGVRRPQGPGFDVGAFERKR
jgi:hypothetical protein